MTQTGTKGRQAEPDGTESTIGESFCGTGKNVDGKGTIIDNRKPRWETKGKTLLKKKGKEEQTHE